MCMYIPGSMNEYNCTAVRDMHVSCSCTRTTPYRTTQNVSKTFRCSSVHSITLPDYSVLLIKYTVDHSLTVRRYRKSSKFVNCARVMQSLDWNAISRLKCNLKILTFTTHS